MVAKSSLFSSFQGLWEIHLAFTCCFTHAVDLQIRKHVAFLLTGLCCVTNTGFPFHLTPESHHYFFNTFHALQSQSTFVLPFKILLIAFLWTIHLFHYILLVVRSKLTHHNLSAQRRLAACRKLVMYVRSECPSSLRFSPLLMVNCPLGA